MLLMSISCELGLVCWSVLVLVMLIWMLLWFWMIRVGMCRWLNVWVGFLWNSEIRYGCMLGWSRLVSVGGILLWVLLVFSEVSIELVWCSCVGGR